MTLEKWLECVRPNELVVLKFRYGEECYFRNKDNSANSQWYLDLHPYAQKTDGIGANKEFINIFWFSEQRPKK